jgi:hypothetical protein
MDLRFSKHWNLPANKMNSVNASSAILRATTNDPRDTTYIPMVTQEGIVFEPTKEPEWILISGQDALMPGVVFWRKSKDVLKMCEDYAELPKPKLKEIMVNVWKNIKSADLEKVYAEQGKAWEELQLDIEEFYYVRNALFNTPVPATTAERSGLTPPTH